MGVIARQLMQLFIPLDVIRSCTSAHATFKYRDAYLYEVYTCLNSMQGFWHMHVQYGYTKIFVYPLLLQVVEPHIM